MNSLAHKKRENAFNSGKARNLDENVGRVGRTQNRIPLCALNLPLLGSPHRILFCSLCLSHISEYLLNKQTLLLTYADPLGKKLVYMRKIYYLNELMAFGVGRSTLGTVQEFSTTDAFAGPKAPNSEAVSGYWASPWYPVSSKTP